MTILAGESLYQRLGGREAIAAVVDDLYDRMVHDSHVWYYWMGRTADTMAAERQQFTDYVCVNAGESNTQSNNQRNLDGNSGRNSPGISKVAWGTFVVLGAQTVDECGLTDDDEEELFTLVGHRAALRFPAW